MVTLQITALYIHVPYGLYSNIFVVAVIMAVFVVVTVLVVVAVVVFATMPMSVTVLVNGFSLSRIHYCLGLMDVLIANKCMRV